MGTGKSNMLHEQLTRAGWNYNRATDCMVSRDRKQSITMKVIHDIGEPRFDVPMSDAELNLRNQIAASLAKIGNTPFLVEGGLVQFGNFDDRKNGTNQLPMHRPYSSYEKLAMRLNMPRGATFGFDWMNIYEGPNTVFVFIVQGEKAIILEDPVALFPSDKIVAQVRLMQEH